MACRGSNDRQGVRRVWPDGKQRPLPSAVRIQLRVADQEGPMRIVKLTMLVGISMLSQTVRERDAEWTAPAPQASRTNPLAGRTGVEAGGNKPFHERCRGRHGHEAPGTAPGPSRTTPTGQPPSE